VIRVDLTRERNDWLRVFQCILLYFGSLGNGYVYIGSHSHRFLALSLDSGVALWDITLGGRIESSAALSHCQQFLIVGRFNYQIRVVNGGEYNYQCSIL